jgi:hypothetical protein
METQKQSQSWLGGAGSGATGLSLGSLWGCEPDDAETKDRVWSLVLQAVPSMLGRGVELPLCLAAGVV